MLLGPVVHPWYLLWGLVPLAAAARWADRPRTLRALPVMSVVIGVVLVPTGLSPTPAQIAAGVVGLAFGVLLGTTVDGSAWRTSAMSHRGSHQGMGQRRYPTMEMEVARRRLEAEN
ncbi:hypothetical protein [Luedemannella flava]|uniref:hypothetical protein n=1 Tax=Luedemannella flava TaxID=349316 RepID=UPI003CD0855E